MATNTCMIFAVLTLVSMSMAFRFPGPAASGPRKESSSSTPTLIALHSGVISAPVPEVEAGNRVWPLGGGGGGNGITTSTEVMGALPLSLPQSDQPIIQPESLNGVLNVPLANRTAVSRSVLDLALRLIGAIGVTGSKDAWKETTVISPFSIGAMLSMLLLGSGGKTHNELRTLLGLSQSMPDESLHHEFESVLSSLQGVAGVKVDTASALFLQLGLTAEPQFLQNAKLYYGTEVLTVDYVGHSREALTLINSWVSEKTSGKITQILSEPPTSDTQAILSNTLYFNGPWKTPFPAEFSQARSFKVGPGDVVQVTMMINSLDLPYAESSFLNCRMVSIPYKEEQVSLYVLLPNQPGETGLAQLESRLNFVALSELLTSAQIRPIILSLPRIRVESELELKDPLRYLGPQSLFFPGQSNLTGIVNSAKGLFVDEIVHSAVVEFTETGTEAAAATSTSIFRDGSAIGFRLDRPFIFFIRYEPTQTVLFSARVVRPQPL